MSIRDFLSPEIYKDNRREREPTRVEEDRVFKINVAVNLLNHAAREMGVLVPEHEQQEAKPESKNVVQVDFEPGQPTVQPVVYALHEYSEADIANINEVARRVAEENEGIGEEFGHAEKAA